MPNIDCSKIPPIPEEAGCPEAGGRFFRWPTEIEVPTTAKIENGVVKIPVGELEALVALPDISEEEMQELRNKIASGGVIFKIK